MLRDVLTLCGYMPVVCNDRCRELQSAENCGFSAVAALGKVINVPIVVQTPIPWS